MCRAEGMLEAFGWLGYGAVLVGRDGRVVGLNGAAENHLGSSIRVVRGRLTARDRRARGRLQEFVAGIARDRPGGAPGAAALPRPRGHPVVACVAPVSSAVREGVPQLGGIILLLDPDHRREPAESLLREAFGFTPAEARLAVGLARDHDLRVIAELHGVSVGTLRVQLKSIFGKTNTRRQGQLAALLAQLSLGAK